MQEDTHINKGKAGEGINAVSSFNKVRHWFHQHNKHYNFHTTIKPHRCEAPQVQHLSH